MAGMGSPLPKGLSSPMGAGDGFGESRKYKKGRKPGDSSLELPQVQATYYGPPVNPSAWAAWDCSRGQNAGGIEYTMFRNRRHGMAIELDEHSSGSLRFVPNDYDTTYQCHQNGLYSQCKSFGAPRMYHELKHKARVGGLRMTAATVLYGTWEAKVKGARVVIQQTNIINRSAPMHIILEPEVLYIIGECSSINSTPGAFTVDGKDPVPLTKGQIEDLMVRIQEEAPKRNIIRAESESPRLMFGKDDVGILRRALTSVTATQRKENSAADQFLALPVKVQTLTAMLLKLHRIETCI